ncbi:MAG: acyltransferase family protein [Bacteroidales bacterium]
MYNEKPIRLGSLDVLRGFDLFALVFFQPVFSTFARVTDIRWVNAINTQFQHVHWEGFAFWDLIMPLFMFMAGASMPFAFGKYLRNEGKAQLYKRVIKRVVLLWILGMIAQGNLLALDPEHIYLFSNTLQAIAIGYLISAMLLMHFNLRWQIGITAGFLVVYWALLSFVKINGYGGGDFSPDYNLAEYIDRLVLGRFRDGSQMLGTEIDFGNYRYTWILSSMNFGVTVMTGVFAGHMMKSVRLTKYEKIRWMAVTGILMIVAGQLWGLQMPVIKKIWTSSMTLYSSGLCFLLMALSYYLIDFRDNTRYLGWLKIYGMNSILAYMLFMVFDFSGITESVLYGTSQYLDEYYRVIIQLGNVFIIFFILWIMHKRGYFLKV